MFTVLQSMQVAQEIQEDHRRRASAWRVARRAHRRGRHHDAASAPATLVPPRRLLAPVLALTTVPPHPVTSVA